MIDVEIYVDDSVASNQNVIGIIALASARHWRVSESRLQRSDAQNIIDSKLLSQEPCLNTEETGAPLTVLVVNDPFVGETNRYRVLNAEDQSRQVIVVSAWGFDTKEIPGLVVVSIISASIVGNHDREGCRLNVLMARRALYDSLCDSCKGSLNDLPHLDMQLLSRVRLHQLGKDPDRHIILTHGIKTFGSWMDRVRPSLVSAGENVTCKYYGVFGLLKLALHGFFRDPIQKDLHDVVQSIMTKNPHAKVSIVSHSFGTLITCRALLQYSDLSFDRLILCNGIVPQNFPFIRLISEGRVNKVLCEAGDCDPVPVLSQKFLPGGGGSGATFLGVTNEDILNVRYPNCGHSTKLTTDHAGEVWLPFIRGDLDENSLPSGVEPKWIVRVANNAWLILGVLAAIALFWWI